MLGFGLGEMGLLIRVVDHVWFVVPSADLRECDAADARAKAIQKVASDHEVSQSGIEKSVAMNQSTNMNSLEFKIARQMLASPRVRASAL